MLQRTIGNIRNTANYYEDQVLDFLDDVTDLGYTTTQRPVLAVQVEEVLPPLPEPAPSTPKPLPPKTEVDLTMRVPFVRGSPVIDTVDGVSLLPFDGKEAKLKSLDGLPYLASLGRPASRRNSDVMSDMKMHPFSEDILRRFPNGRRASKIRNNRQSAAIKRFDSEVGWQSMNVDSKKPPVDEILSQVAFLDNIGRQNRRPVRPRRIKQHVENNEKEGNRRSFQVGARRNRHRQNLIENRAFNPLVSPLNTVVPIIGKDGDLRMIRGPTGVPGLLAHGPPPIMFHDHGGRLSHVGFPQIPTNNKNLAPHIPSMLLLMEDKLRTLLALRPRTPDVQREIDFLSARLLSLNHRFPIENHTKLAPVQEKNQAPDDNFFAASGLKKEDFVRAVPGVMNNFTTSFRVINDDGSNSTTSPPSGRISFSQSRAHVHLPKGKEESLAEKQSKIVKRQNAKTDKKENKFTEDMLDHLPFAENIRKIIINGGKLSGSGEPKIIFVNAGDKSKKSVETIIKKMPVDKGTLFRDTFGTTPKIKQVPFTDRVKKMETVKKVKIIEDSTNSIPVYDYDLFPYEGMVNEYFEGLPSWYDESPYYIDSIRRPSKSSLFEYDTYDEDYPLRFYDSFPRTENDDAIHSVNLGPLPNTEKKIIRRRPGTRQRKPVNQVPTTTLSSLEVNYPKSTSSRAPISSKRPTTIRLSSKRQSTPLSSSEYSTYRPSTTSSTRGRTRRPFWSDSTSRIPLSRYPSSTTPAREDSFEKTTTRDTTRRRKPSESRRTLSAELSNYNARKTRIPSRSDVRGYGFYDGGDDMVHGNRRMDANIVSEEEIRDSEDNKKMIKEGIKTEEDLKEKEKESEQELTERRRRIRNRIKQRRKRIQNRSRPNEEREDTTAKEDEEKALIESSDVGKFLERKIKNEQKKNYEASSPFADDDLYIIEDDRDATVTPEYATTRKIFSEPTYRQSSDDRFDREESPRRYRKRINQRLAESRRRQQPRQKYRQEEEVLDFEDDMYPSHSVPHLSYSNYQSIKNQRGDIDITHSEEVGKSHSTKLRRKQVNSQTNGDNLRVHNSFERLNNMRGEPDFKLGIREYDFVTSSVSPTTSSFNSFEAATPVLTRGQPTGRKRLQAEPDVITIDDVKKRPPVRPNPDLFSSLGTSEDDPIVSNLKAVFFDSASSKSKFASDQIKSSSWYSDERFSSYPLTDAFVDPRGRFDNPIRSLRLQSSDHDDVSFRSDYGSFENLRHMHLSPRDLFEKDKRNFASIVMKSDMNLKEDSTDVIRGKLTADNLPQKPSFLGPPLKSNRRLVKIARPKRKNADFIKNEKVVAVRPARRRVGYRHFDTYYDDDYVEENVYQLPSLQPLVQSKTHATQNNLGIENSEEKMSSISFGESVSIHKEIPKDESELPEIEVEALSSENIDSEPAVDLEIKDGAQLLSYPGLSLPELDPVVLPLKTEGRSQNLDQTTAFLKSLWDSDSPVVGRLEPKLLDLESTDEFLSDGSIDSGEQQPEFSNLSDTKVQETKEPKSAEALADSLLAETDKPSNISQAKENQNISET